LITFAGLYVVALALFGIGTFGLFGSDPGPLAGIFLMPLGLPWNMMLDAFPAPALPWLAASAPTVNLLLLWGMCRLIGLRDNSQ
jgi:hypothetical protein